MSLKPIYVQTGSVKANTGILDSWFLGRFGLSPYMGCQHGCLYCDGRAEKYYFEGDFTKDIRVRRNIPKNLKAFIRRMREPGFFMIGSGVSDSYQPIEEQEKLMPELLTSLRDFNMPVVLLTKSDLMLRDIDLITEINERNRFIALVTITTINESVASMAEPMAPTVEARFQMIEKLTKRGIPVGIMMMPLLPLLSDGKEDVTKLLIQAKKSGAVCVMPGGLTLRPGRQKDLWLKAIKQHYPNLEKQYHEIYIENKQSGSPIASYSNESYKHIYDSLRELKIPTRIPHQYYRGVLPLYDEVFVLLSHLFELYPKFDTKRLRPAFREFTKWLKNNRTGFKRYHSQSFHTMEARLKSWVYSEKIEESLANPKLITFIKQILANDGYFDYVDLKWIKDR